jgi:hypothetical protein
MSEPGAKTNGIIGHVETSQNACPIIRTTCAKVTSNRVPGAGGQNRTCFVIWTGTAKQMVPPRKHCRINVLEGVASAG